MNTVQTIVVTLLGVSPVAALVSLLTVRTTNRKSRAEAAAIEGKTPAEIDSIAVQGAQTAVLAMNEALRAAQTRIAELERLRGEDRERIRDLEDRVARAYAKAETAETAAAEARSETSTLRSELAAYVNQRDAQP